MAGAGRGPSQASEDSVLPRDRWTAALTALPLLVVLLLLAFAAADPALGVTASTGPFTDESWDVMNARNLVLLGTWATDDWTLHLVNLPFSISAAAVFSALGVGIVQARIVSIVATGVTVGALGLGLRKPLGGGPALLAASAFAGSTLVLYYGRLAFLEPSVGMWLVLGTLTVLRAGGARSGWWGLAGGALLALAVGTKPSALAAVGGVVVAVAVVGAREAALRRWVAGAAAAIVALGAGWALLIGLPNRQLIGNVLRIWASEPIVAPLGTVLHRIATFPTENDGFLVLSLPAVVVGAAGWVLGGLRRQQLTPAMRLLFAAATGWIAAGLGLLMVAPYRPNRYEEPLLPAFAILIGIGVRIAADAKAWPSRRWMPTAALALSLVLVVPGVASFAGWMRVATDRLPQLQAQVAHTIPAGSATQGTYAPALAMRARVLTIVSRPADLISPGDLYATRNVRWFVGEDGETPAWAALHPGVWQARQTILCTPWGTVRVCLYRLP